MLIKNGIGLLLISYMIRVFRCFHLSRQTKKISKVLVSVFFFLYSWRETNLIKLSTGSENKYGITNTATSAEALSYVGGREKSDVYI